MGDGARLEGEDKCAADGLDAAVVDVVAAAHAQHLAAAGVDGQRAARGDALAAADGDAVERHEEGLGCGARRARRRADGLVGAEALEVEGVDVLPDLPPASVGGRARGREGRVAHSSALGCTNRLFLCGQSHIAVPTTSRNRIP